MACELTREGFAIELFDDGLVRAGESPLFPSIDHFIDAQGNGFNIIRIGDPRSPVTFCIFTKCSIGDAYQEGFAGAEVLIELRTGNGVCIPCIAYHHPQHIAFHEERNGFFVGAVSMIMDHVRESEFFCGLGVFIAQESGKVA